MDVASLDKNLARFNATQNSWLPLSRVHSLGLISDGDGPNAPPPGRAEYKLEQVFPVYASAFSRPGPDSPPDSNSGDRIWRAIMEEAKSEAEKEPILSSFLYATVLSHDCLERALSFVLANRLQNPTLLATQLMDIFSQVIMHEKGIHRSIRLDLQAFKDRDPSCLSYCWVLLYLKGYHSLQSYRVAHVLWNQGRRVLALALQSRISEALILATLILPRFLELTYIQCGTSPVACVETVLYGPSYVHTLSTAAKIGEGILLDHATGVVIGETAVVGDRVSLMQGVTLGGTGKELGDRHPTVGDGALIGASANILGNIKIGEGAMVAAGSLVLSDVPPHSMVAGIPAKIIGHADEQDPSLTMNHDAPKDFFEQAAGTSREG